VEPDVSTAWLEHRHEAGALQVAVGGGWTVAELGALDRAGHAMLDALPRKPGRARISLGRLEVLDTAGAWLLRWIQARLTERGWQVELADADASHAALIELIERLEPRPALPLPPINPLLRLVAQVGAGVLLVGSEAKRLLSFYGQTIVTLGRLAAHPSRLRLTSLVHHLEQTCLNALPIVGMISFLIGVVLA
jgi:phospholipid/cholesterol/gamma-HCH transport system permease protein